MPNAVPSFRDVAVGALLTRLAETLPDREALVYADRNLRFTFAGLDQEARRLARGSDGVRRRARPIPSPHNH